MKKQKLLSALTACTMLCGMMAVMPDLPVSAGSYGNLTYEVYDDHVAITACNTMAMSVNIPNEIEGLPVTRIEGWAFRDCTVLNQIVLPDTLKDIGYVAFMGCSSLTEIEFPYGLESIGTSAFEYAGLTSVEIPDSVTSIGDSAFCRCDSLETAVLGSGMKNVIRIFNECAALTEVTIPSEVESLSSTFSGCAALTTVNFEDGGNLQNLEYAFDGCTSLVEITLPDTVSNITYAFTYCAALKEIVIPASVTSASNAFWGCTSLEKATFEAGSQLGTMENMFGECVNLKEIVIPKKTETFVHHTFWECNALEKITVLNPYLNIPNEAVCFPESSVIYCYENSTAHAYALLYGREFVIMPPPALLPGDLNDDTRIDATDASMILVAATNVGANLDSGLTAEQITAADLNVDSTFDAVDASIILQYATYVGAGGELSIEEFIATL